MLGIFLSAMALAIALFSLILLVRFRRDACALPLMLTLLCLGALATGPVAFFVSPILTQAYVAALPLVLFALLPSLWLYHQVLISPEEWQWRPSATKHYLAIAPVCLVSLLVAMLPEDDFDSVFFADVPSQSLHAELTAMGYFVAIITWCVASLGYTSSIFSQTYRYHGQLKNIFADHKNKKLWWVEGLTLLMVFSWGYALLVLAVDNRFARYGVSENGVFLLLLLMVWALSAFGLRQQPGFAELFNHTSSLTQDSAQEKYRRSALQESDFKRIAGKLSDAMQRDKLYLESELNLMKLSEHTGISTQNLSQTLNQHLGTSFFDFINAARIDAAKPMILAGGKSILDIAFEVGFNARSSFYKAFKQSTGMTPGEYKKQHA